MTDDELRQARDLIAQERLERERQCGVELEDLLKRYNCTLDVALQSAGPMIFRVMPVVKAL